MSTRAQHTGYGSSLGAISTGANSLANGSSVLSGAINNTTSEDLVVDIFIKLAAQGSARSGTAGVNVYLCASPDGGTTYVDAVVGVAPWLAFIGFDAATTARLGAAHNVDIPPGFCKLMYVNNTGQAFAASGNTIDAYPHTISNV